MDNITEKQNPKSKNINILSTSEILKIINREDHLIANEVKKILPKIELLIIDIVPVFVGPLELNSPSFATKTHEVFSISGSFIFLSHETARMIVILAANNLIFPIRYSPLFFSDGGKFDFKTSITKVIKFNEVPNLSFIELQLRDSFGFSPNSLKFEY